MEMESSAMIQPTGNRMKVRSRDGIDDMLVWLAGVVLGRPFGCGAVLHHHCDVTDLAGGS